MSYELRESALAGRLTLEQVHDALDAADELARTNGVEPDQKTYWRDEWLADVNQAFGVWWPRDAPQEYAAPMLDSMLRMYWHPMNEGRTFMQDLEARAVRCSTWLEQNSRSAAAPNESDVERRRRLTRERVRRHRQRHTGEAPAADPVVDALRAELAEERAKAELLLAPLRAEVGELHARMMEAAARKREIEYAAREHIKWLEGRLADAKRAASEDAAPELGGGEDQ